MPTIKIRQGLDIPIHGAATSSEITEAPTAERVALLPQESWGIKVRLLVAVGDEVKIGTPLFADRRDESVPFGSPAAGKVVEINRGHRRAVLSVVVETSGDACIDVPTLNAASTSTEEVRSALIASGLWPCLRRRPYDSVARSEETPRAIIVQAHDSRPLAGKPQDLLQGRQEAFRHGLALMHKLSGGKTFLAVDAQAGWSDWTVEGVTVQAFDGPHPAGLPLAFRFTNWHPPVPALPLGTSMRRMWPTIGESFLHRPHSDSARCCVGGPRMPKARAWLQRSVALPPTWVTQDESNAGSTELRALSGSVLEGRNCNAR